MGGSVLTTRISDRANHPDFMSEKTELKSDAPGSLHPVVRRWRIVHDPEEIHQLRESGGNIIPAVLGGCGASANPEHAGEYWWSAKTWDGTPERHGYAKTLDEAKASVETIIEASNTRYTATRA